MKIRKLRISHFGKFHNEEFSFTEGINLIRGGNESGKSTMHAFIRAMLFGIDKQRGRAGKDDLYTRYQPWDTPGAYQGSMDFEHEGHEYRITRVFYQSEKSCVLTDLDTGRQIPLADDRITGLIPELTLSAYNNTVSAGQTRVRPDDSLAEQVRNYLANLSTSGTGEVDVDGALDRLNDRRKALVSAQNELNLDRLRTEREQLLETEEDETTFISDRDQGEEELQALRDKRAAYLASDDYRKVEDFNAIPAQEERVKNLFLQREEAEDLDKRMEERRERKTRLSAELADATRKAEECRKLTGATEAAAIKEAELFASYDKRYKRQIMTGVLITLLGPLAALALYMEKLMNGKLLAAAVLPVVAGLTVILLGAVKKRENAVTAAQKKDIYKEAFEQYDILNGQLKDLLTSKEKELNGCEEKLREDVEQVGIRFSRLDRELAALVAELTGEDTSGVEPEELWKKLPTPEMLRARFEEGHKHRDMVNATIDTINDKIRKKSSELERISWELERIGDIGARLETNKQELAAAEEKARDIDTELQAVRLAINTITKLAEDIHDSFGTQINVLLSDEAGKLTDGRYKDVRVNRDFGIEVMSGMDYVPAESLSTGAVEQLWLALRLAVGEMFFAGSDVPILLDESFAYYDEDRLRAAMEALAAAGKGQVLLFTCRDREQRLLDETGVEYNLITL